MNISTIKKFTTAVVVSFSCLVVASAHAQQEGVEVKVSQALSEHSKKVAVDLQNETSKSINNAIRNFRIEKISTEPSNVKKHVNSQQTKTLLASK